ncbi:protein FAM219A isoform X5 [Phalacrocorax carbo]|uniref:protein FAM219A isoform X5 n=1 Tax=Phalacrocorax carbo TaxID=9209 RepID=UPI003119F996
MMEEIDRFQVPAPRVEMQPLDPTAGSISDRDCDTREGETVAMNYKPSPLQVKLEKQRQLARKGSLKNGNMGTPVNQQPKKNNVMARTRWDTASESQWICEIPGPPASTKGFSGRTSDPWTKELEARPPKYEPPNPWKINCETSRAAVMER